MARRRLRRGTDDDDFTYVDGGRIRRIRFEGSDEDDIQEFQEARPGGRRDEVEFQERPAPQRAEGSEEVIRVRDYQPRHIAPIDDIEFEVDHLNEIKAGRIPKGTPPGRTDLMRGRAPRDETVYETERGRVTREVGPSGPVLYVERGSALRSERFRASLVDVLVKDVDLEEEVVIRRKIVEDGPTKSTTKRVTKKRSTKKKSTAKAAPAKKPAKRAKKVAAKAQRAQVSVGDYKLFHTGNRYFFSKKSQAESAKGGAAPVYEIPANRKVVETPNGLPVLKAVGAKKPAAKRAPAKRAAAKKPAPQKSAATSVVSKPAAKKAPVKKAAVKRATAKKPAAKKAPVKKAAVKRAAAKKPAAKKAPAKKAPAKRSMAKKPAAKKATAAKKPAVKAAAAKKKSDSQPQCAGLTADGKQCRNSARGGSKYCASHKGYHPRTLASIKALDTVPAAKQAKDTKPTKAAASKAGAPQAQCAGLTADGKQCRNSSRGSSKYCASHKGYRPTKGLAALDTKPRAKKAADTKPTIRKG